MLIKRTTLFALAVGMLLSCGYASAEPALHQFSYLTSHHMEAICSNAVDAQMVRERAVLQWQYDVAQGSRVARSDMHASSAGFVFTAMTTDSLTGINPAT
ncbi:hypothetical protein ACVBEG_03135 [Pseudomonas sp. GG8]